MPAAIPMEFPVHPIQETGKRPTAALDRNLQYLSLVEVLHGYPIDGVVLTTGCDKTTPAMLMGAATSTFRPSRSMAGRCWTAGTRASAPAPARSIWEGRRLLARGEIDYEEFMELACASAPSLGHCNTMGTASTMNALAEALGMTLPGSAAIPAPFRERDGDGLSRRAAHRRHGAGGPEALRHPDPRGVRERHQGQHGHRRLDQRAAASAGDRAAHARRGARCDGLADPSATTCRCW
jgi:dihydroxyacid dehydratase/phosphogluconate dehydratase